jgi:hypothetical protein
MALGEVAYETAPTCGAEILALPESRPVLRQGYIRPVVILTPEDWQARRTAHGRRVRPWIAPHQRRARCGKTHPVYDFLFSYYAFRPGLLTRWHPGPGIVLGGVEAEEFLRWREYRATADGIALDPASLAPQRREFAVWVRALLVGMRARPPFFGCFGMHEWAMVYRQTPEAIRHQAFDLRFPPDEIARIVEGGGLSCTHYDAFRFFTAPARPLNRLQPTRPSAPDLEQRGCLHANLDLYKWAFKLTPYAPSELVADCFELARDIREVDMRASPYDLRSLGFPPIRVETAEGRADYEQLQRGFLIRSEPLRDRLIALCAWLTGSLNDDASIA